MRPTSLGVPRGNKSPQVPRSQEASTSKAVIQCAASANAPYRLLLLRNCISIQFQPHPPLGSYLALSKPQELSATKSVKIVQSQIGQIVGIRATATESL